MRLRVRWLIAITSLIIPLVVTSSTTEELFQRQIDSENASFEGIDGTRETINSGKSNRLLLLLDWSAFMRFFNKRYSSLVQQMVRQRIFLARVLEVFLTGAKYKFFQLSYYTAINKWSDTTPEESNQILNGDSSNDEEGHEQELDDDDIAEQVLMDLLALNQQTSKLLNAHSQRHKRDTSEEGRNLSVADLILVEPKQLEPDPRMRIKWIVDPDNPNYVPVQNLEASGEKVPQTVKDISPKELSEITNDDRYNVSPAKVLKDAFDSSIKWWSLNKEDSRERKEIIVIKDWRESGCISPPRDQGYCASCYAISSISMIEWQLCMSQNNVLTPLSVQYMVSCGLQMNDETNGQIKLMGCKHGMSRQTMDFVKEYGVELEANLPYYERETACPILPFTPKKYKGYMRPNVRQQLRLAGTTSQLDLALKNGPIIVSMREPKNFLAYGGGFIENCEPKGGHAMLVVGNMIEDGVEYLLIKNSFGQYWGYDGYFKFKRTHEALSECVKEFIVPVINFPGRRAQARRVKAYLARQKTNIDYLQENGNKVDNVQDDIDNEDISDSKIVELLLH